MNELAQAFECLYVHQAEEVLIAWQVKTLSLMNSNDST